MPNIVKSENSKKVSRGYILIVQAYPSGQDKKENYNEGNIFIVQVGRI